MKRAETVPDSIEGPQPPSNGADRELPKGTMLGRFVITQKVAQGGMGIVYAAIDSTLERKVAVKVLRGAAAERRERLLKEARDLARLSHPNVVRVLEVGRHLDHFFLAMDFIGGGTLTDWLERQDRSPREIVNVFLAAGRGLAAAHAVSLVHRDFKRDNVLLDGHGVPHVTDFGLALDVAADGGRGGTPGYMAPEQSRGEPVDARADQFSFCASLYEALYGRLPFPKDHKAGQPLPLIDPPPAGSNVPAYVRRVIFKGLAEDRNARFASMDELLTALADDPARRQRIRVIAGASFLSIAGLVFAGVTVLTRESSDERARRECIERAQARGDAIWGDERRGAISGAFAAARGHELFARVDQRVRREVSSWVADSSTVCRLPVSDANRRRWSSCLEEQRKTLQSLSDVFAVADASVVKDAPNTVMLEVQPVSACSSATAPPERTAPQDTAADERMRTGLAKARVLKAAGKYDEALFTALGVLDEAVDTGASLVEAEAQLLTGELYALMHRTEAKRYLEAALLKGETLGNDELRAKAWIAMVPACLDSGCDAELAAKQADALLERLGRPALLEAARLNAVGLAALSASDTPGAEAAFRRSLELRQQQLPKDHPLIARSLNNLAWTLPDDRRVPVLESNLELRRAVFGENHPETANAHHNLGEALGRVNRCADALSHFETALAFYELANDPARLGEEQASYASALLCVGRMLEAIARQQDAVRNLKDGNAPPAQRRRELQLLLELMNDAYRPAAELEPYQKELEAQ